MQIPNASIAEILGKSNYDWVAIDLEHGSFSLENLPNIFRSLEEVAGKYFSFLNLY